MTVKNQESNLATKDAGAIDFLAQFWAVTDLLFGIAGDVTEYKKVVLGLVFLKYISDCFEEQHARLIAEQAQGADPEDPAEYYGRHVFWVAPEARWLHLVTRARQPTIRQLVDNAIATIERDNPDLRGVLPRACIRPVLERSPPGKLIDLISDISIGDEEAPSNQNAARAYEAVLSRFARADGNREDDFITPRCVVKLLVEMIEPYRGRVYDPCCGSGGMLVQAAVFGQAHGEADSNGSNIKADISIYGQESKHTTWQLAKMNLAIRGLDGQIVHGDTFHDDRDTGLEADFIFATPPFNDPDWGSDRLKEDERWKYGVPPPHNANFAWLQHIVRHMAPGGVAGIVLAEGSMSSNHLSERKIRKALIEAHLVDCIVALPRQLFYSRPGPVSLWLLTKDRENEKTRDRRGEILFIDAGEFGQMTDRSHRELTDKEITRIADTYHAWRAEKEFGDYKDIPGFCGSAPLEQIGEHGHVLTPEIYVRPAAQKSDVTAGD